MNLKIDCENVNVTPKSYFLVNVKLEEIHHHDDIIKQFDVKKIIDAFGEEVFLDHIGVSAVKRYFDLKNNDDDFE